MSAPIKLASHRAGSAECAEMLADYSRQAALGEVVSVVIVYERPDGAIDSCQSSTRNRTKMAGALLEASVRRLGFVREGD